MSYQITPAEGEPQVLDGSQFRYGFGLHAVVWKDSSPADVVATISWKDGNTTQLKASHNGWSTTATGTPSASRTTTLSI